MSDEVNLTGLDFEFQNEKEAVLAQYICANVMKTVGKLEGELIDGLWEVPVPVNCSQGLRCEMTDEARSFVEPESLPGCQTAMEYLNDNGLSTQVPYDVASRCSVTEHKLRITAFCALRNILRHTGSMMKHRDGTHRSLHDICSIFTLRCTGFEMPCPVLYVFLKYRKFIHFTCSFLAW